PAWGSARRASGKAAWCQSSGDERNDQGSGEGDQLRRQEGDGSLDVVGGRLQDHLVLLVGVVEVAGGGLVHLREVCAVRSRPIEECTPLDAGLEGAWYQGGSALPGAERVREGRDTEWDGRERRPFADRNGGNGNDDGRGLEDVRGPVAQFGLCLRLGVEQLSGQLVGKLLAALGHGATLRPA